MELWAAAELPATMVEEASCGGFGGGAGLGFVWQGSDSGFSGGAAFLMELEPF